MWVTMAVPGPWLIRRLNIQLRQSRCLEHFHLASLQDTGNRFHTWTKPQAEFWVVWYKDDCSKKGRVATTCHGLINNIDAHWNSTESYKSGHRLLNELKWIELSRRKLIFLDADQISNSILQLHAVLGWVPLELWDQCLRYRKFIWEWSQEAAIGKWGRGRKTTNNKVFNEQLSIVGNSDSIPLETHGRWCKINSRVVTSGDEEAVACH